MDENQARPAVLIEFESTQLARPIRSCQPRVRPQLEIEIPEYEYDNDTSREYNEI